MARQMTGEMEAVALPCGWEGPRLRALADPCEQAMAACQVLVRVTELSDQELAAELGSIPPGVVGLWRIGAFLPPTSAFIALIRIADVAGFDALRGLLL